MTVRSHLALRESFGSAICLGAILVWSGIALASGPRLSIDPAQDLTELSRTGRVPVSVSRLDGVYTLDASAVLPVALRDLLTVSTDYDRYTQMGIPHLRECHVVRAAPESDLLYTWSSMSYFGQSSKHYLAVRIRRNLTPSGGAGVQWQLAHPETPGLYTDAPAFVRLEGSWYLEPLTQYTTYVRYTLVTVLDPSVPEAMISWIVKQQLAEGTRDLIHVLAREASLRP
jgi:hypothetical protein